MAARGACGGLLLAGLLLGVAAAEVGLRLAGYRPPHVLTTADRQQRMEPNGEFIYRGYLEGMFSDFATPVRLNSLGFHDVEHRPERSPTNTFRLMVVGDSYVAALSCPLERTFFRLLEARLNREDPLNRGAYEVIACGRGNQAQEREVRYVDELGPVYKPDAVLLLFFCGNDFMENSPETFRAAAAFAKKYKQTVAPRKVVLFNRLHALPWLRLNGLVAEAITTCYADHLHLFVDNLEKDDLVSPELGVYRVPLTVEWRQAYARTDAALKQLKIAVRRLDVPLLVAGLSGPQAIGDLGQKLILGGRRKDIDLQQPARWLAAWCASNAVPYVALEPALAAAGKGRVFWRHDGHLNPRGNAAMVAPLQHLVVAQAAAGR